MYSNDHQMLVSAVARTAAAAQDYLATTGDAWVGLVPEHCLQVPVGHGLCRQYGLWQRQEVGVGNLLGWLDAAAAVAQVARSNGFFDVALFEPVPGQPPDEAPVRVIIELKATMWTGRELRHDAARIRDFGKFAVPLCGIVVGLFMGDGNRVVEGMATSLQIDPGAIIRHMATQPDHAGNSYGAVGALVH